MKPARAEILIQPNNDVLISRIKDGKIVTRVYEPTQTSLNRIIVFCMTYCGHTVSELYFYRGE